MRIPPRLLALTNRAVLIGAVLLTAGTTHAAGWAVGIEAGWQQSGKLALAPTDGGSRIVLDSGNCFGACFSPDATEVAYVEGGAIKIIDIYGNNERTVKPNGLYPSGTRANTLSWCTNGYLYYSLDWKIYRVKADGTSGDELVHTSKFSTGWGGDYIRQLQVCRDGTRAASWGRPWISQSNRNNDGHAIIYQLGTPANDGKYWDHCMGGLSMDGSVFCATNASHVDTDIRSFAAPDGTVRLVRTGGGYMQGLRFSQCDQKYICWTEMEGPTGRVADHETDTIIASWNGFLPQDYYHGDLFGGGPATYALTVNSGSGDGSYAADTVVTITAGTPPVAQVFDAWTGDVSNVADVNAATTTVTMPAAPVTVTATYKDATPTDPTMRLTPAALLFEAEPGGASPASEDVDVANTGPGTLNQVSTSVSYLDGSGWLTVTRSGSGNSQALTNSVDVSGLSAGVYSATVTVSCAGAVNSPQDYAVTFSVGGLLGHWTFDEGAGTTAADSSGLRNDGTVNGATWSAAGAVDGALDFDGVDDHVAVPYDASLGVTRSFTVAAWIRPDTVSDGSHYVRGIVAKLTSGSDKQYALSMDDGQLRFDYEKSSNDFLVSGGTLSTSWHHVAATTDDALAVTLYVDGTAVASATAPTEVQALNDELVIGRWGGSYDQNPFDGLIDDVRIYSRALSAVEIVALAAGAPPGGTPTIELTSPVGGEVLNIGSPEYITWTAENLSSVALHYSIDDGATWIEIDAEVLTSEPEWGAYLWIVPDTPSSECRVRVSQSGGPAADVSSDSFLIGAPQIDIESPGAGDVWYVGTTRHIRWTAMGIYDVTILYATSGTGGPSSLIESSLDVNDPEWSSFAWTVPDTPSTECAITIHDYNGVLATAQSESFEIRAVTDLDGDGMDDGWEDAYLAGVSDGGAAADADGDGLSNLEEFMNGADPTSADTDGDGMPDAWEVANNLDPATDDSADDPDGDGHTSLAEYKGGSDPHDALSTPSSPSGKDSGVSCAPAAGTGPALLAGLALALACLAGLGRSEKRG